MRSRAKACEVGAGRSNLARIRVFVPRAVAALALLVISLPIISAQPSRVVSLDFQGPSAEAGWTAEPGMTVELQPNSDGKGSCLKITQSGARGWVSSPEFSSAPGYTYRVSMRLRAQERREGPTRVYVQVVTSDGKAPLQRIVPLGGEWEKLSFGGVINSGDGSTRVRLMPLFGGRAIWLDDLSVEAVPSPVPKGSAVPRPGDNLIPNGSFEVESTNFFYDGSPKLSDQRYSLDCAYGSRSLHLRTEVNSLPMLVFDGGGEEFALSASVKAVDGGSGTVRVLVIPADYLWTADDKSAMTLTMSPTYTWQRHSITAKLPRSSTGSYLVRLKHDSGGPAGALIDGLMLTRGNTTDYRPAREVEASLSNMERYQLGYIFDRGQPLKLDLDAHNESATSNTPLNVTLTDDIGRVVRTQRVMSSEPGKSLRRSISWEDVPQGFYSARVYLGTDARPLSQITLSVLPLPRKLPAKLSNWGSHVYFSPNWVGDKDDLWLSPRLARLDFRWNRSHDADASYLTRWDLLEPTQGTIGFPQTAQTAFQAQRAMGMSFLGTLNGAPDWAIDPGQKWVSQSARLPGDPDAYEAYVKAVVKHYGSGITHWEIGNEPAPAYATPERYAEVVGRAVRAIRSVDPNATIISLAGMDNCGMDGPEFIDRAIAAGATKEVDAISFHYAGTAMCGWMPDSLAFYSWWRGLARRGQSKPLQLWDTEEHCDTKVYAANTAMGVRRTFQYIGPNLFENGVGSLTSDAAAFYIAGNMLQGLSGGGLYKLPNGVVGALSHDSKTSILGLWSERFKPSTKVAYFQDPFFAIMGGETMSADDIKRVPAWMKEVHPTDMKVPAGVGVFDRMGRPMRATKGTFRVGESVVYLRVSRAKEGDLLKAIHASQAVPPNE